jgi:hypothetical protein
VLPMLSSLGDETAISKVFRRHLEAASVTRPDLFAKSTTQLRIRFRSLRDAGITWRLWRGDNPFVVQRNAGHKRFTTTEKYVGDIEKLTAACGVPFRFFRPRSCLSHCLTRVMENYKPREPLTDPCANGGS